MDELTDPGTHSLTKAHSLMQWVINAPMGTARVHNTMIMAVIIDEFQVLTRVYNPDNDSIQNLTDSFQHASETRWAPMLISGSSVFDVSRRSTGWHPLGTV